MNESCENCGKSTKRTVCSLAGAVSKADLGLVIRAVMVIAYRLILAAAARARGPRDGLEFDNSVPRQAEHLNCDNYYLNAKLGLPFGPALKVQIK